MGSAILNSKQQRPSFTSQSFTGEVRTASGAISRWVGVRPGPLPGKPQKAATIPNTRRVLSISVSYPISPMARRFLLSR